MCGAAGIDRQTPGEALLDAPRHVGKGAALELVPLLLGCAGPPPGRQQLGLEPAYQPLAVDQHSVAIKNDGHGSAA